MWLVAVHAHPDTGPLISYDEPEPVTTHTVGVFADQPAAGQAARAALDNVDDSFTFDDVWASVTPWPLGQSVTLDPELVKPSDDQAHGAIIRLGDR